MSWLFLFYKIIIKWNTQKSLYIAKYHIKYHVIIKKNMPLPLWHKACKNIRLKEQEGSHRFLFVDWIFMPLSDYQILGPRPKKKEWNINNVPPCGSSTSLDTTQKLTFLSFRLAYPAPSSIAKAKSSDPKLTVNCLWWWGSQTSINQVLSDALFVSLLCSSYHLTQL